jgi:hypothetical protein
MTSLKEEKNQESLTSNIELKSKFAFYARFVLLVLILGGLFFTLGYGYAMKIEYNKCNQYWFDNIDRICTEKTSYKNPYQDAFLKFNTTEVKNGQ